MDIPNIDEVKESLEILKRDGYWGENENIKAFDILISLASLVINVSEKMGDKRFYPANHIQPTCQCKECLKIDGYNLARTEDILTLTKWMMGMEEVIEKYDYYTENMLDKKDKKSNKIATALRQSLLGEQKEK